MKDRLKILDCNRKAVLGLPDAAFKLWHCYYMNEDDEQESWLSIPEIMAQTGKSRRSIIDWTKWLVANHWLIDTGKTAADKWMAMGKTSTIGSHQIHVYRVDDPVSSKVPAQNLHQCKIGTSANDAPKGSGSNSSLTQTKHSQRYLKFLFSSAFSCQPAAFSFCTRPVSMRFTSVVFSAKQS